MSDRLTLDTGTGEPVHVKLAEGQDRASLEEDLMEAARNGTVVTVKGSVKGTSSDTIHINPSNALWWAIDDAPQTERWTHLLTSPSRGQAAHRYAA